MDEDAKTQEYTNDYYKNEQKPARFLMSLFHGHGLDMVKTFVLLIIKQSPVWVIPIVTSKIINVATYPADHRAVEILVYMAVALVFLIQNIGSSYLQVGVYSKVIREIEMNLRGTMIRKLQYLSISFHKEMQSGRLLSKIMRDVENVENLLYQAFGTLVNIFLDIGIAVTVIAMNSPVVLIFFVCVIPVAVAAVYLFRKPIRENNREFRQEMEQTQAAVAEMVELIPVTRAHGLQKVEIERMDDRLQKIRESGYRLDLVNMLFGATSWVIFQAFEIFCLAFTAMLAYRGEITIGEVVLYQTYFTQIVNQVVNLINIYPGLTKGLESVKSVGEIIGSKDLEQNNSIIPLGTLKGEVEFRNVCFHYRDGKKEVLKDFNLKVKAGESVAFVGGSGAGKSTILNLMIGFDTPDSGSILIDGINMANLNMNEYRSQIAMVPQNTILFSGTVRDNITYGMPCVPEHEIWKVLREVGLDAVVQEMPDGLDTVLGEHGGTLSGGQRQRISIARALIRKPKIVIFDEATSALDSESEKKVQEATAHMMKCCTTFMVAHRLSTIKDADRICVVQDGKIVEEGNYESLMEKQGIFYQLKTLQQ